jgi:tripartite-type tricarboxylate transporter receptor subunit TctC
MSDALKKPQLRRALLGTLASFVLAVVPLVASAQAYPNKAIHIIVPFSPGGGSDAIARLLGTKLSETIKQSVVVENKPGAGGILATQFVANAPPDGYTLLLVDTSFAANISVYPKPGYSLKDFAAVASLAAVPSFVMVGQHVPATSIAELIALAKAKPGSLNMASGGAGGVSHLQAARFAMEAGITWSHIPYRGVAPALMDAMSGQADVVFTTAPAAMPHMKSGRARALAVTSAKRSPFAPDVPTLAELGMPRLTMDNWYGLVAPAKTDPAVVKKLLDQLNAAVRSPDVRSQLSTQTLSPSTLPTSAEFDTFLNREVQEWTKTAKAANISVSN